MSLLYSNFPKKATLRPSEFIVNIPQSDLDEFHTLLKLSKVGPPTYESLQQDRKYGITHDWLTDAKRHWENSFDWRAHERKINSFPNFVATVLDDDGSEFKLHFAGLFSDREDAIPIVLLHGWPGSFLEFLPILSLLKKQYSPTELPYHVIVPSLPGYAFSSGPPAQKDFDPSDAARIIDKLLVGLGFGDGYVAQGGDVGSRLAQLLSEKHAACKAIHLNLWITGPPKDWTPAAVVEPLEKQGLELAAQFFQTGAAYMGEHATRPATVGLALSSSPLALLAWIGEKFIDWVDEELDLDIILESVTLYWLTQTYPRSLYAYREIAAVAAPASPLPKPHLSKPFGFSWFPKELVPWPKSCLQASGNLVFFRRHQKGGHFAAMEQPEVLLNDLVDFIAEVTDHL